MECKATFPFAISLATGMAGATPPERSKVFKIQVTTTSSGTNENTV